MAKELLGFSKSDCQRINNAVRWVEQFGGIPPVRRRPVFNGGGGGESAIWAEVVRGLQYADPAGDPVEGYDRYVVRLLTDGTAAWDYQVEYAVGIEVIGSDNRKYASKLDANTGNDPINSPDHWQLSDEISPMPLSMEVDEPSVLAPSQGVDMRRFVPWFTEGSTVKLIKRTIYGVGTVYFFDQCQIRVKAGDNPASVIWNEIDHRLMAVFA